MSWRIAFWVAVGILAAVVYGMPAGALPASAHWLAFTPPVVAGGGLVADWLGAKARREQV